ncbi:protein ALP1-like [Impatiens glandulifera]|uniref:protein ALP1-like n=1 Tax=Impatiens glandulifera TaxID=253017 RepID=UPI001FB0F8E6|nr:protein ALP1-like [Impatiens glandulifera]XP_047323021.1 protein ALP1-like [Impatiens glandulifera]XP_047323022.1 protein ALP1-like [Impatiens glandulifera]
MGPTKGLNKRKKIEIRNAEANANASGFSQDGAGDWWDTCYKNNPGLLSPSKGMDDFESVFKISRKAFDYICTLVHDQMTFKSAHFVFSNGMPMCINDLVAVALRRLSSGDSLIAVADSFGTNHSTVSQVTWRFVEAIEEKGLHHLQWPSTQQEIDDIKSKFEKIQGLPNCCGAIDTTHIVMVLSSSESRTDVWLDREKNHSMILQAIVGPDMKFLDIVTGWPGKMDDISVLRSSTFSKLCENGVRLNGMKMELSEGTELGEYVVGHSGYPTLPWLLTPFRGKNLLEAEVEFNRRHLATRMVAQRALAGLKEKWRIIKGMMWRPDKNKLPRIILVCCILHNIAIEMGDETMDEIDHDNGYKQESCDDSEDSALPVREKLALYLSGRQ